MSASALPFLQAHLLVAPTSAAQQAAHSPCTLQVHLQARCHFCKRTCLRLPHLLRNKLRPVLAHQGAAGAEGQMQPPCVSAWTGRQGLDLEVVQDDLRKAQLRVDHLLSSRPALVLHRCTLCSAGMAAGHITAGTNMG